MPCSYCEKTKIFARGMCQACYYRLRRNGSVERKNMATEGDCSVAGCNSRIHTRGLCQSHYRLAQHPVKTVWKLLRSRNPGQFPENWDSFDQFMKDVGDRPTPQHRLKRLDISKPFSAENVRWNAPIGVHRACNDEFRSKNPDYPRAWLLHSKYGLTIEDYERLIAEQNSQCPLCLQVLEVKEDSRGRPQSPSVDHCHKTGKVRGIMCKTCNTAIGLLRESPEVIRRAADYVERHMLSCTAA